MTPIPTACRLQSMYYVDILMPKEWEVNPDLLSLALSTLTSAVTIKKPEQAQDLWIQKTIPSDIRHSDSTKGFVYRKRRNHPDPRSEVTVVLVRTDYLQVEPPKCHPRRL